MKKLHFTTAWVIIFCLFAMIIIPQNAQAQETAAKVAEPTTYVTYQWMSVEPENRAEYVQLEKLWKRIHKARIEAGALSGWYFREIVSPSGTDYYYQYLTINVYRGEKQLAGHFEGLGLDLDKMMTELFTEEEQKLLKRTSELRDICKEDVFHARDGVGPKEGGKKGLISVINLMKTNSEATVDMKTVETNYWKPVHQARVDANELSHWRIATRMMPSGTSLDYNVITADFYTDWMQFLNTSNNLMAHFEKIHPNKDHDKMMNETSAARDLTLSIVTYLLASTDN